MKLDLTVVGIVIGAIKVINDFHSSYVLLVEAITNILPWGANIDKLLARIGSYI